MIRQLSIFLENKPGRLAEATKLLAEQKIDIRALSIADTTNLGILRLIVNKPQDAEKAFKEAGFTVSITKVIGIVVPDQPGGLYRAITVLSDEGIGVEYMYAFVNATDASAYVILRVEDSEKAVEILTAAGIEIMDPNELYTE